MAGSQIGIPQKETHKAFWSSAKVEYYKQIKTGVKPRRNSNKIKRVKQIGLSSNTLGEAETDIVDWVQKYFHNKR